MTIDELAAIPTKSTEHMTFEERRDGIGQMLADLNRLANEDGCIAAAWAAEFLEQVGPLTPPPVPEEKREKLTLKQHTGFNALDVFKYLQQFPQDELEIYRVFIRMADVGELHAHRTLDYIQETTCQFFGRDLPCLVLSDDRFAPSKESKDG